MTPPTPAWDVIYRHDRRAHRHRCVRCNRILQAGEAAVMARVKGHKTIAVHADCATQQHGTAAWTWRDALVYWGAEYLIACGWRVTLPRQPTQTLGEADRAP